MIYKAIIGAMKDIGAVGKNQRNTQQNFMFRGIDAVMNAINPALIKNGIFIVPGTEKRRTADSEGSEPYLFCMHYQIPVLCCRWLLC